MTTISMSITMDPLTCGHCGIPFALERAHLKMLQDTGKGFHCPAGCSISYHKTELDRVRDQLAREKHAREQAEAAKKTAQADRDFWLKQSNDKGKKIERLKKRVANGVCPCCTRHFTNLERHIKTKHPSYKAEAA